MNRERDEEAWWTQYQAIVILIWIAGVLAVAGIVGWGVGLGWSDAGDAGQFFQSLVTIAALATGGVWTFYVFARGRAHAAFVEVRLEAVGFAEHSRRRYAVVGVAVRNTGRVKFETGLIQVEVEFFDEQFLQRQLRRERIVGASTTPRFRGPPPGGARPLPVLTRNVLNWEQLWQFEPGQEARDEVVVSLGDYPIATAEVRYVGYIDKLLPQREDPVKGKERWRTRKSYSTRVILDPETVRDGETLTPGPAGTNAVE